MSLRELAGWLGIYGRPIAASGLSRIEAQERAVDVDDLVALAVRLAVPPNALLFASEEPKLELAPNMTFPSSVVWQWARGERPLHEANAESLNEWWRTEQRALRRFAGARDPYALTVADLEPYFAAIEPVRVAAQAAVDQGVPREVVVAVMAFMVSEPRPRKRARKGKGK